MKSTTIKSIKKWRTCVCFHSNELKNLEWNPLDLLIPSCKFRKL